MKASTALSIIHTGDKINFNSVDFEVDGINRIDNKIDHMSMILYG